MKMSTKIWRILNIVKEKDEKMKEDNILVGAAVIAAMAYQAAISPPGGVAGRDAEFTLENKPLENFGELYELQPSASLLAFFYYGLSNTFWVFNTMSLLGALSVILIYISGASSVNRKIIVWPIRFTMCISLLSMTGAYACAVLATSPSNTNIGKVNNTRQGIVIVIIVYVAVVVALMVGLAVRFICYMVREMSKKNATEELATEEAPASAADIAC